MNNKDTSFTSEEEDEMSQTIKNPNAIAYRRWMRSLYTKEEWELVERTPSYEEYPKWRELMRRRIFNSPQEQNKGSL